MNLDEIPPEIHDAAKLIEAWMKEQGVNRWEFGGICSRNHADVARSMSLHVRHSSSCTPHGCVCGLRKFMAEHGLKSV